MHPRKSFFRGIFADLRKAEKLEKEPNEPGCAFGAEKKIYRCNENPIDVAYISEYISRKTQFHFYFLPC